MYQETQARSVMKAFTWRLLGTVATTLLVFVLSGRLTLSLAVGVLEFVSKIGLYWLHERLWDRLRFGRKAVEPSVIWFTGLSGAGKSTIADWVAEALRGGGFKVERLDGDTVRNFFPSTGFARRERDEHVKRVGYLASKLEQNGVFVVASFVSPYRESRDFVRRLCQNFVEVYVSTPIEVCEARDVKGLYAKARRGEVCQFTGIDDPFEAPTQAELVVDTTKISVAAAGQMVLKAVQERRGRRLWISSMPSSTAVCSCYARPMPPSRTSACCGRSEKTAR
jgi:adenylylsulfate kinase